MNMTQKLIASHLVSGSMQPGEEIAIVIDQTLTQEMCIRDRCGKSME